METFLDDNANVDLDDILKLMLERLDAVNSFPLNKKREARRLDGMYFVLLQKTLSWFELLLIKEVSWALTKFRHIQPLQSFLEKVATSMKVVTSIDDNVVNVHSRCSPATGY